MSDVQAMPATARSVPYSVVKSSPMTVIACAYTPEGFVVGADGLRVDATTHQDITHTAQKIFPVRHSDFYGIHAWAGATWLFSLGSGPFVAAEEAQSAINELSERPITSLATYVADIGSLIYDRLVAYNRGTKLLNPNVVSKNNEIFCGMFVGYLRGHAWMIQISFPHENGVLLPPVLNKICEAPNEFCMFSASKLVWFDIQATVFEP
jgi:hypothetical protein